MGKIRDLYNSLMVNAEYKENNIKEDDSVPSGHVRVHNKHKTRDNEFFRTRLFKLSNAKEVIEKDEIGKVYLFVEKGEYTAVAPSVNLYIGAGETKIKNLQQTIEAVNNLPSRVFTQYGEEMEGSVVPYEHIISVDTVKKLQNIVKIIPMSTKKQDDIAISAKDGYITATDGEQTVYYKEKVNIQDFENLSAKGLKNVSGELYVSNGIFTIDGYEAIEKSAGEHEQVQEEESAVKINMNSKVSKLIETALKSADKNNPKLELNGIAVDVKNGKAVLVSTDTRRLTVSEKIDVQSSADEIYIIRKNPSILKADVISLSEKTTCFENKEFRVCMNNIQGKYPNYERIVVEFPKNIFSLNGQDLVRLIKDEKKPVLLKFSRNFLKIYRTDEDAEYFTEKDFLGSIEAKGDISEGEVPIVFNPNYIVDAIGKESDIQFGINGTNLPAKITAGGYVVMVMPIVYKTKEDKERIEAEQADRRERERQRREEWERREFEEKLEIERKMAEEEGIAKMFLDTLKPMQRGKAKATLLKTLSYKGKSLDSKDFINQIISEGYKDIYFKEFRGTNHKTWVAQNNEKAFFEITKTEAQFAQFLIDGTTLDSITCQDANEVEEIIEESEYINSKLSNKEMVLRLSNLSRENFMKLNKIERLNILNRLFKLSDGCEYWSDEDNSYSYRCEKQDIETLNVSEEKVFSFIVEKVSPVDTVADSIEESIMEPNKHIKIGGINITIESKAGQFRRGIDGNGNEWANELKDDYGFFNLTIGRDNDEIDVFINSDCDQEEIPYKKAYYIKQNHRDGTFDEIKFVLGADSMSEAKRIYFRNYDRGYTNSGSWYEVEFERLKERLTRLTKSVK